MGHRFSKTAANNIATSTTATAGQESASTRAQALRNQATLGNTQPQQQQQPLTLAAAAATTTTRRIPIPNGNSNFVGPTINLQIQESPTVIGTGGVGAATCHNTTTTSSSSSSATTAAATGILQQSSSIGCSSNNSSSLTSVNNLSCGRQIIIKIQLAKMENGNELSASSISPAQQQQQQDISLETLTADCNLNSSELMAATTTASCTGGAAQILNLTLNSSSSSRSSDTAASATITQRTAGSSPSSLPTNNNYLNTSSSNNSSSNSTNFAISSSSTDALRERLGRLNTLQFNDEIVEQNIGEIVEYCEVLEDQQHQTPSLASSGVGGGTGASGVLAISEETEIESNVCCRRKSKSLAANGGATSSSSKRRCRKCSCRDAFRRILDPSLSRSSNKAQKQQQQQQQQQQQLLEKERREQKHSRAHERHSISNIPSNRSVNNLQVQRNSMHSTLAAPTAFVVPPTVTSTSGRSMTAGNQVAVWGAATTTNGSDVIIPLTTPPQFVVVQCAIVNPPSTANTTTHHNTNTSSTVSSNTNLPPNSIISITHNSSSSTPAPALASSSSNDIMVRVPQTSTRSSAPPTTTTATNAGNVAGPIVHSQVDFVHYLVPDLERITNSSFYWGKMDRYEAERLLEGKPEGTFLLRDSAQEEFLFSVTFRKYARSLHARIEQSGHRFSFDCHDPCVYTAPTVTGLLEHYKDPACVMFFEPMLTIPLHRKNCFSLQQLCRATIVSNTTYDGINELELPSRLKSYLKEYHYKQKLRVKSNEPTYTIHCK